MNDYKQIYTTRPALPPLNEYIAQLERIWDSKWLTNMGALHNELEEELKEYLRVQGLSLFVNGHMALEMVLQAMDLRGEVITTPFTFISTIHAITRNGLTPVFCDINKDDYTMDVTKIEELITEKTSAILPVHVYGNVCNVEKIEQIAGKYHLKVIYDAAHAFGVQYKEKGIGNFGDASMFSFHATKVFNSIEGGAVTYRDNSMGRKLYNLKNFGIRSEEEIESVGANAKMNEFQAAMGLCNLKYINENIQKRKKIVEYYHKCLSGCRGVKLNSVQKDVVSNYSYMPVVFVEGDYPVNRNVVYDTMKEKGIFARKYFYPLANEVMCYKDVLDCKKTPIAKKISQSVLTLPLYADLKEEDVDRVSEVIWKLSR